MANDAILAKYSLIDEVRRLAPDDNEAGRRAEILVKEDDLRITLVTMRQGVELDEHSVPVSIGIHVLRGRFAVHYDGETLELDHGDLVSLRKDVRHTVRAIEDGAFLLTLGWPASKE
jgi:quercetin dioxygenase-like cupin family protein